MHTIAAKIILMDNVNDGSVEYPKTKANRIGAVSLSEPLCNMWGKADKVNMPHEAVPKEAFLGESEPLCSWLHKS